MSLRSLLVVRAVILVVVPAIATIAGGCFEINFANYRCDAEHACLDGFTCVNDRCIPNGGEGEGEGAGEGEGEAGEGEGEAGEGEGEAGEGEGEGEPTICGDGVQTADEACDTGASNSDTEPNACRTNCALPFCGDLITDSQFGESCDDGNVDETDGCTVDCVNVNCGNGAPDAGEQCDDGVLNSDVDPDACRETCVFASCNDGVTDTGEACDGGDLVNGDGCDINCTESACGNAIAAAGEECDDGDQEEGDGCDSNCTDTACGNGINTLTATQGLRFDVYDGAFTVLPNFATITPVESGRVNDVDISSRAAIGAVNYAFVFKGQVLADDAGTYTFFLTSDDGSRLFIDGGLVVDNDGLHSETEVSGAVVLAAGPHAIRVEFFQGAADAVLRLDWQGPTFAREPVPADHLFVTVQEACDDGALNSDAAPNACRTTCALPSCGDLVVDPINTESCDDGNVIDNDDCSNACVSRFCGDGVLNTGEQCDDGLDNSDLVVDACRTSCVPAFCGDAVTDTADACDDGDLESGDGCDANCTPTACGNGITTASSGEQCDDGDVEEGDGCDTNCTNTACGNGVTTASTGEVCDDGNLVDGDGCDSNCTTTACGNGIVTSGEDCDDDNVDDTDDCLTDCNAASCGDGFVRTGVEQCDDGLLGNSDLLPDACRTSCFDPRCGDTVVDTGETCDDANTVNGDGCSPACQSVAPACGDGFVDVLETCDDGNTTGGDGCNNACAAEGGFTCFGEPSVCCTSTTVRTVPAQHATIQAAINAVPGGIGCVFVSAGTFDTGGATTAAITGGNVTVVGAGAAVTTMRSSNGSRTVQLSGSNAIGRVQGFTIIATNGAGVTQANNNSQLTLTANIIGPTALAGVEASGNNRLIMRGNVVTGCVRGGVLAGGGDPSTFENNFIVQNGSAAATVGGIEINSAGSTFRHNTVADNIGVGVRCVGASTVFGSIVFANSGAELNGACTGTSSAFEGGAGTNIDITPSGPNGGPDFVGGDDYHLQATSPCIDRIASSTTARDFDGDPRPSGASIDIGADERR